MSTRISFGTEIYSGQETEVKEISTTYCSENKIAQYLAQTILAGPTLLVERRPVTGLTLKYRQDTKAWLLGGKNLFQYTNNVYVSTFNPKTPFGEMPTLVDSLADIEGKCNLDLSERATRLRALETQLLSARTNPPSLKVLGNVRSKYLEAKANYKNTQDTCRTKIANKQHQYEAIKVITDAIAIHMTNQKNALTDVEATKY